MKYRSLQEIFDAFNDLNILVIGDAMIDSYVWGHVERISPEAPVPIVQVRKKEKRLGGAANVIKNIQALGARPILCTIIGEDQEGHYFLELLKQRNLPGEGVLQSKNRKTSVKERFLAGSQHVLRVDDEHQHELNRKEKNAILEKIDTLLPDVQAVVFQDYDKGILSREVILHAVEKANAMGVPTIVDPKKKNFAHYRGVTLFKPNLKEIRDGMKIDLDKENLDTLKEAVLKLKQKMNLQCVMLTLSDKGILISGEETELHIPAHVRSVSDVSGAGDTVVSIASLGTALGLSTGIIAELSNLGGGLVCEHLGVVPVDKEKLLEEALKLNLSL